MARDFGGIEQLLPDGIRDLRDCPYPLYNAIQMALQFIGWHENLEREEIPPRAIWFNADELEDHFNAVNRRRKEKYGGDDDDDEKDIEGDVVENSAARRLLVGR